MIDDTPTDQPEAPSRINYKAKFEAQAIELANQGQTYSQIAKMLSLNKNTIGTWIADHRAKLAAEQRAKSEALGEEAVNPVSGMHHKTRLALDKALKSHQSADDKLAERYSESREAALETLIKAARGKKVEASSINAAKEILKQQPIKPREQLSQLSVAKNEELIERALVTGCSLIGVAAVRALLDELEASGQAVIL